MISIPEIELKEGEKVIMVVRRYLLTYAGWWLLVGVLFVVPFLFLFWLFAHGWWGQSLFFILAGFGTILLLRTLLMWRRNVFVITTHRLIDKDQRGLLDQMVSEVPYDQIEDVSGRVRGIFGTVFGYGQVAVQTGGGNVRIVVDRVRHPLRLQQEINDLRERFLSRYSHEWSGNVATAIIEKLYELDEGELKRVREATERRLKAIMD